MRKEKVLALLMAVGIVAAGVPTLTSNAAELTQATSTDSVKYTKLSAADEKLLQQMFDYEYYKDHNPDVVAAIGDDPEKLFQHFVQCGIFEGRSENANFNPSAYASAYSDLSAAFGSDIMAYYRHYAVLGVNEARPVTNLAAAAKAGITVTPLTNPTVKLTPAVIAVAEAKGITDPTVATAVVAAASSNSSSDSGSSSSSRTNTDTIEPGVQINDLTLTTTSSAYRMGVLLKGTAGKDQKATNGWESSNTDVAIIDENGEITVKAAGTTTITCTLTLSTGEKYSDTCTLTVKDANDITPVITIDKSTTSIVAGVTDNLNSNHNIFATVTPLDATVTWSSSDSTVATVQGSGTVGQVIGLKAGTATITAKITVNGVEKTATCEVTVEAAPVVDAATPTISQNLSSTQTGYAALSITATVSDGGTLSYQWYNGDAVISGATLNTYTPNEAGSYKCVVTNTNSSVNGNTTATATSAVCAVTADVSSDNPEVEPEQEDEQNPEG